MDVGRALSHMFTNRRSWITFAIALIFSWLGPLIFWLLPDASFQFDTPSNRGGAPDYEWSDVFRIFLNIGIVLSFVAAGWLAVFTYASQVIESLVEQGDDQHAPRWRGVAWLVGGSIQYFALGLVMTVIGGVVLLAVLIMAVIVSAAFGGGVAGFFVFLAAILACFVGVVILILAESVACARLAVTESVGESLDFGQIVQLLRAAPGGWILAVVVPFALTIVLEIVLWIPGLAYGHISVVDTVVSTLTSTYTVLVTVHLLGQAYRNAQREIARRDMAFQYRWVAPQAW